MPSSFVLCGDNTPIISLITARSMFPTIPLPKLRPYFSKRSTLSDILSWRNHFIRTSHSKKITKSNWRCIAFVVFYTISSCLLFHILLCPSCPQTSERMRKLTGCNHPLLCICPVYYASKQIVLTTREETVA